MITISRMTAAIAATIAGTSAFAVPVTWDLMDVTFDDGGTASGYIRL